MNPESARGLLVVNTSRSWGGNEHWALQVAEGLARRGARVRFVWSHDVVGERVRAAGLDNQRLLLRADGDLPAVLRLGASLRAIRARAVVPTRWREYLLAGIAARLAGRPRPRVVMRLGLAGTPRDDLKRRLVFRLADRILVNAPEVAASLCARSWIDPRKVAVVFNGVDLDRWRPRWEAEARAAGAALRAAFGVPAAAPLLLAVGAFSPQKDFAGLLHAVACLRRRWPDLRLLLLGDGFLRAELEALRTRLDLDDVVLMPGFRADVAPAMAAADLFVLSSTNEGMARVLVEAAASGLPAVATAVSGTAHAVANEESGLVVPPADPEALADAVARLLRDPPRRAAMGRRARALAEERFAVDRMLEETARVLLPEPG